MELQSFVGFRAFANPSGKNLAQFLDPKRRHWRIIGYFQNGLYREEKVVVTLRVVDVDIEQFFIEMSKTILNCRFCRIFRSRILAQ